MATRASTPVVAAALAWAIWAASAAGGCRRAEVAAPAGRGAAIELRDAASSSTKPAPGPTPVEPEAISDDPVLISVVEHARRDSQVARFVEELAVEIGPRLTGTAQAVEAELWAVDQFESWGLAVTREPWGELPVGFERGKIEGALVRPARVELELGSDAWTPGTRGQTGVEAGGPVRGQALLYPQSAAELRARKPYLRDAWLLIPHEAALPRGTLAKQIERALDQAPIAGLVRAAAGPDDDRITTGGDHRLDPAALPTRVEVLVRGDQFQAIVEQLDAGVYVELEIAVGHRLLPGPVPVHNVVAALRGRELPEQQVIVGAHLDSWDGARGAVDNATGVATTMEAARLLAEACARTGRRPRRTISFHLWTGEEQGLLGSSAWVEAHEAELAKVSAVLVHDNGTNYLAGLPVTPELHDPLVDALAPVTRLDPASKPFTLELVEALPLEPSDSTSFLRAGVPGFFWRQRGRSDYARYHHTQFDEASAVIDEYQRHSALVVALAAWGLAERAELLPRANIMALEPRRLGVALDQTRIIAVLEGTVAARLGLEAGDRVVAVDGQAVTGAEALVEAIRRGDGRKRLRIEREGADGQIETVELDADWSGDPGEIEREARRRQRRENFGPELLPWDDHADGRRDDSPRK